MSARAEYRHFLNENFNGLRLRKPLFYSWDFGLRFDLQVGSTDTEEYFNEVTRRASTIFETAFDKSDKVFFVFMDYKYKRRKIRPWNFAFKQINNLNNAEISYSQEKNLYQASGDFDMAIIKLTADRINYKNILTAIGNSDFSARQPRLDQNGAFTTKEIYFLNIDRKLIFHMYDDRGLDIIAADKETIRSIYTKHNDWILDYDREQIDKRFK